jgi:nucleoside-diphosphate-sugar epimerase
MVIAGKSLTKRYELSKPQGVRGRNSDNSRLLGVLNWEPSISLEVGLTSTYKWIEKELQVRTEGAKASSAHAAD